MQLQLQLLICLFAADAYAADTVQATLTDTLPHADSAQPVVDSTGNTQQAEEVVPAPTSTPTTAPMQPSEPAAEAVTQPGFFTSMDTPRNFLSEKIVTYSKDIDEFFGDKRYFQEKNDSVILVGINQAFEQSGNNPFAVEVQAKLDFPSTQKRYSLVLESNPDQKTAGEAKTNTATTPKTTAPTNQYAASLRFEKHEESRWHFSSELGAQFQFPLEPFTRMRGSYSIPIEDWRLKVAETLFWFSTSGLGATTQLDFERLLSPPVLFRSTSISTCFEAPQNCDLSQSLSVYHTLSDKAAIVYQASVIGVSQPEFAENDYILLLRYRYRLHKEWIFFEITPQIHFPRTDNFKLNGLLLLRLEMLFGATK
ncbi:MAG: hypothetical protein ACOH1I_01075 [Gallionellaceae bacterium]